MRLLAKFYLAVYAVAGLVSCHDKTTSKRFVCDRGPSRYAFWQHVVLDTGLRCWRCWHWLSRIWFDDAVYSSSSAAACLPVDGGLDKLSVPGSG